jgi:hypothetical protein
VRHRDELERLGELPASVEERADAESLAGLVDDMLEGRAAPPAMDAEERALLETATQVHASLGEAGLPPARAKAILDSVLPATRRATTIPPPRPASVTSLRPRRRVAPARLVPWAVATLCAAAALVLWLRVPDGPTARALRSPDAVIGAPIAREHAADASARLDALLADRRAATRGGP